MHFSIYVQTAVAHSTQGCLEINLEIAIGSECSGQTAGENNICDTVIVLVANRFPDPIQSVGINP